MHKKNTAEHLKSKEHTRNVAFETEQEAQRLRLRAQAVHEAAQHHQLSRIELEAVDEIDHASNGHIPLITEYETYHDADGHELLFSAGEDHTLAQARQEAERLRHELELLELSDWEGEVEDDDDITMTSIMDDLQAMGMYLFLLRTRTRLSWDVGVSIGVDDAYRRQEGDDDHDLPNVDHAQSWFPYKNKTVRASYVLSHIWQFNLMTPTFMQLFMLDLLDNLPRLRMSDAQFKAVLFIMRECGASDVPSLDTLRRAQKKLRKNTAVSTERFKSGQGNVFYVNNIQQQLAQVRHQVYYK